MKIFNDKNISIFAVLISIISIVITSVFGLRQCSLETKLNKLHIEPHVECYLIRSKDKKTFEFHLKNKSPISVVNLSVAHKYFIYFDNAKRYVIESRSASSLLDSPGQNWIFKKKLDPNESTGRKEQDIWYQLNAHEESKKNIVTAIFEITFYRESDMKQFNNKAIFFLDNEKIYSYKNALKHKHLIEPIKQLPEYELQTFKFRKNTESNTDGNRLYQKAD